MPKGAGAPTAETSRAQRSTVYPQNFRLLLDQLGIDSEGGRVLQMRPEGSLRVYGGWFFFIGELIEAGERMTDAGSGFEYYFVDAKRLPKPQANFGQKVLAVEFTTKLPWVISEQP